MLIDDRGPGQAGPQARPILTSRIRSGHSAAEAQCLANACSVGALSFVSDIDLTRMPASPLKCSK